MSISRTGGLPSKNEVSVRAVPTGTRTTTSTAYVDWPVAEVLSVSFTKQYSHTDIIIEVVGSYYLNSVAGGPAVTIGANIGGSDYDAFRMANNVALSHTPLVGITDPITGLAAGAYTVTLRAKTAANTLTADTGDFNAIRITEVL